MRFRLAATTKKRDENDENKNDKRRKRTFRHSHFQLSSSSLAGEKEIVVRSDEEGTVERVRQLAEWKGRKAEKMSLKACRLCLALNAINYFISKDPLFVLAVLTVFCVCIKRLSRRKRKKSRSEK